MGAVPSNEGDQSTSHSNSSYDELVLNNQNLIDLHSSESDDFPFCGSPVEIEQEKRRVERLLMKGSPGANGLDLPATSKAAKKSKKKPSGRKKESLPLASYGHSAQRVREIQDNNEKIIKRLVGVANAPLAIKKVAAEHDKVSWC